MTSPTFPIRSLLEENVNVKTSIVIATDLEANKKGVNFRAFDFTNESSMDVLNELLEYDNNFYEVIYPDVPVKPYFDLEIECDVSEHLPKGRLFIDIVTAYVLKNFGIQLDDSKDFYVLDSCRAGKLSYHLLIQNQIYLKNVAAHKVFSAGLFNHIMKEYPELVWGEKQEKCIMDTCVYGKCQNFRCVNQSKKGKGFTLKNVLNVPIGDLFVGLYFGTGDRKCLPIVSQEPAAKIKKLILKIADEQVIEQVIEIAPISTDLNTRWVDAALESKVLENLIMDYDKWLNMAYILNDLTNDIKYFKAFSTNTQKDRSHEYEATWKCISMNTERKRHTLLDFQKIIKKINPDVFAELKDTLHPKEPKPEKKIVVSNYDKDSVEIDFPSDKLLHFDSEYINSLSQDYQNQKRYFEKFVSKVMRPEPQYIYVEGDKDLGVKSCIFSEHNITQAFRHCRTWVETSFGPKLLPFSAQWLDDPELHCYNMLDFIPYNGLETKQENQRIYNLFSGYNPKIKTSYNENNKDKILKPFLELALELCGGNDDHASYFLKFLGHMIQKPNEKIPICFIIKGKQGTGKNVFLNAVGNIVGKEHYITSSNPRDFFGDYAEGFYHKLLVNMNECEGKDTFDFEGKIKSFITEDTITINPKNIRPTEIRNVARTIIFTNKPNPIPIDVKSSDRRYCVFQTTDKYLDKKYGTQFWTALVAHFNKPEFIACLYDYFNALDINVDWRTKRPITQAYKDMCKLYVPVEALFMEDYINKIKTIGILIEKVTTDGTDSETDSTVSRWEEEIDPKNKEIYDEYVRFCKANGFSNDKTFQPSISKFNNRMTELEIPHRLQKSVGINEFRFTPGCVYNHLVKRKWINRDEDDPEVVIEDTVGDNFVFDI